MLKNKRLSIVYFAAREIVITYGGVNGQKKRGCPQVLPEKIYRNLQKLNPISFASMIKSLVRIFVAANGLKYQVSRQ